MSSRHCAKPGIGELWSPEQISGYLKTNGQPGISHEAIYQRIYADKRIDGVLRCQKARKKRYGGARATRQHSQPGIDHAAPGHRRYPETPRRLGR